MSNPAEIASEKTLEKIYSTLKNRSCFRVEAGAGAGKTYSLIKALQWLVKNQISDLQRKNQNIACITYTNVAVDEIKNRIDNDSLVYVDTIHGFSWLLIKDFQKQILKIISTSLDDGKLKEKIEEAGGLLNQKIIYDLGYRKVTKTEIYLHHDDVIKIFTILLSTKKFISILKNKFPIIFIDEYQDTNKELTSSIISNIIDIEAGIQIGFFGDHWQKIYDDGIGEINSKKIDVIGKEANFRSEKKIVEMLNRMRPELPQMEKDPLSSGEIKIFHTNNYTGERRDGKGGGHWTGDLPAEVAHSFFLNIKNQLTKDNWDFGKTKVLMLTNNVIAKEQGYENLAKVFSFSDDYLKMQDKYIDFLVNIIEPVAEYFNKKQYGEMFKAIGIRTPRLNNQSEKKEWNEALKKLINARNEGSIGDVIQCLKETQKPRLSSKIEEDEERYESIKNVKTLEDDEDRKFFEKTKELKSVDYKELIILSNYINDKTPFSTNHGVKGAEYENVFVVCGRGWNKYNWDNFLSWEKDGIPSGKEENYKLNRNLFYVSCSRPKKRLAILFTQKLSNSALDTLDKWFLKENVKPISDS